MRDVNAERRLLDRFFQWSGALIFLGVLTCLAGAGAWIVATFWGEWPLLIMLVGLWLVGFGVALSVITTLAKRGLQ